MDSKLSLSRFVDLPFFLMDEEFSRSRFLYDDIPNVSLSVDQELWDKNSSTASSILPDPKSFIKKRKRPYENPIHSSKVLMKEDPSKDEDEVALLSSFMSESQDEDITKLQKIINNEHDETEIFRRLRRRDAMILQRIRNSLRKLHPEMQFVIPPVEQEEEELLEQARRIPRKDIEEMELQGNIIEAESSLLEDDDREKFHKEHVEQEDALLDMIQKQKMEKEEMKRKERERRLGILRAHDVQLEEEQRLRDNEREEDNRDDVIDDDNVDDDDEEEEEEEEQDEEQEVENGNDTLVFDFEDDDFSHNEEEDDDEDEDDDLDISNI